MQLRKFEFMQSLKQTFQVPFQYEVFFTKSLFDPANTMFADFIRHFGNPEFQKRILFVVDKGVADAHPNLTNTLINYFDFHSFTLFFYHIFITGEAYYSLIII